MKHISKYRSVSEFEENFIYFFKLKLTCELSEHAQTYTATFDNI